MLLSIKKSDSDNKSKSDVKAIPELYRDFAINRTYYVKTNFREHYKFFLTNGLSKFEAWYNAFYIAVLDKRDYKARKIKKEYKNLDVHPNGWFAEKTKLGINNRYDHIISLLDKIPQLIKKFNIHSKNHISPVRANKDSIFTGTALLCAALAVSYIMNVNSYELHMMMYIDNSPAGIVTSTDSVTKIIESLESKISEDINSDFSYSKHITYKPIFSKNKSMSDEECYDKLLTSCQDCFTDAYVLLIDGIKIAANCSYDDISNALKAFEIYRLQTISEKDSSITDAKLLNNVTIEERLCLKSELKAYEDIFKLLASSISNYSTNAEAVMDADRKFSVLDVEAAEINVSSSHEDSDEDILYSSSPNNSYVTGNESGIASFFYSMSPTAQSSSPSSYNALSSQSNLKPAENDYDSVSEVDRNTTEDIISDSALNNSTANTKAQEPEITERINAFSLDSVLSGIAKVNENIDYGITRNVKSLSGNSSAMLSDSNLQLEFKTTKTVTIEETVDFPINYIDDTSHYTDYEVITQYGSNGSRTVTYEIDYISGVEYSRRELASEIISAPIEQTVIRGTKVIPSPGPTGSFIWPIIGYITSDYGSRSLFDEYDFHLGLDIDGETGDPVQASDGGTVTFAGQNSSYGNYIILDHGNGITTRYAHLSNILVSYGDVVYQGQIIGEVGETGVATGSHLHFEIRINNSSINPLNYLN